MPPKKYYIDNKATVNPVIDDDEFFQYAETVALNHTKWEKIQEEYQKLNVL